MINGYQEFFLHDYYLSEQGNKIKKTKLNFNID